MWRLLIFVILIGLFLFLIHRWTQQSRRPKVIPPASDEALSDDTLLKMAQRGMKTEAIKSYAQKYGSDLSQAQKEIETALERGHF